MFLLVSKVASSRYQSHKVSNNKFGFAKVFFLAVQVHHVLIEWFNIYLFFAKSQYTYWAGSNGKSCPKQNLSSSTILQQD
jgi:hypothetical protein